MQRLCDIKTGQRVRIEAIDASQHPHNDIERRLLEFGLDEGVDVEVFHTPATRHAPMAVRVYGMVVALRPSEAACLRVRSLEEAL